MVASMDFCGDLPVILASLTVATKNVVCLQGMGQGDAVAVTLGRRCQAPGAEENKTHEEPGETSQSGKLHG